MPATAVHKHAPRRRNELMQIELKKGITMLKEIRPAVVSFLLLTLLTGIAYPLARDRHLPRH